MPRSYEVEPREICTPRYARAHGATLIVRKTVDGVPRIMGYYDEPERAERLIEIIGGECDVEDFRGVRLP